MNNYKIMDGPMLSAEGWKDHLTIAPPPINAKQTWFAIPNAEGILAVVKYRVEHATKTLWFKGWKRRLGKSKWRA